MKTAILLATCKTDPRATKFLRHGLYSEILAEFKSRRATGQGEPGYDSLEIWTGPPAKQARRLSSPAVETEDVETETEETDEKTFDKDSGSDTGTGGGDSPGDQASDPDAHGKDGGSATGGGDAPGGLPSADEEREPSLLPDEPSKAPAKSTESAQPGSLTPPKGKGKGK